MTHNSRNITDGLRRCGSALASWVSTGSGASRESGSPAGGNAVPGRGAARGDGGSPDEMERRLAPDGGEVAGESLGAETTADDTPPEQSAASTGASELADATTRTEVQLDLGLSLEEFVVALLEDRDGRLKQRALVDRLDWSKATVSRLLQDMEDDGRIVRVELGREKTVYFPDQAPGRDPFSYRDGDGASTV